MKNHKVLSLLPRFAAFLFGVVLALSIAGDQVPVIAGVLVDEVGKVGIVAPSQYGPTGANVGNIAGVILIVVEPKQLFTSV